jgi:glucose-1-phosphate cytidylyltransferase
MKVVILAGGLGTRLSEETELKPKPMVEVGGRPILWHIMKLYAHAGFNEFVVALGHQGSVVKRYFAEYANLNGNLHVNLGSGIVESEYGPPEDWMLDLVDTGLGTNTGGRVRRLHKFLNETFLLTYGDGVSDVDIAAVLDFHRSHGKLATMTAVRPPARFGHLTIVGDSVTEFSEKPQIGEGWINGGFFVLEPEVLDYIDGDHINLAHEPLEKLAKEGQLMAYQHGGFWQCMDTIRDKEFLNEMWVDGAAPWKVW